MALHPAQDGYPYFPGLGILRRLVIPALFILAVSPGWCAAQAQDVVANVNDHVITAEEFQAFFSRARRQTFYHGTPPPAELEAFRVKTLQDLINRLVLLDEATRRGLEPDQGKVEAGMQQVTQRLQGNPEWEQQKDSALISLRQQLESGDIIRQLEVITRDVGEPSQQELLAYYESHPDTFTEPRQNKVSLILFGVDPSAANEDWELARELAADLIERLRAGEDFATLAQEFSTDPTRANGGDMGYLHQGMLNDQAESALSELAPGEISAPVKTLEGYAVLRLDDIREPVKRPFGEVIARATALWQREEGDRAWKSLIENLRDSASISILDPSLAIPPQSPEA